VPEHLLHTPQVCTTLQQVSRHCVAKAMRPKVGRPLGHLQGTVNNATYHSRVDPLATLAV
jgi:hypothetical protein